MKTVEIYLKGNAWVVLSKENGVVYAIDEYDAYEGYSVINKINRVLGTDEDNEL